MSQKKILDTLFFGYPLRDCSRYFDLEIQQQVKGFNIKELKNTFISQCESLLGGKDEVILPLSGGLDSRLILSMLLELIPAKNIYAFNYGTEGQLDFDIPPIIAKKAGINFQQVNYRDITINRDVIDFEKFTLENTPSHNIIGFYITKIASEMGLDKLGVDGSLPVWSGFLGDRVFTGMWSDKESNLKKACENFIRSYAINSRDFFPLNYNPTERLHDTYRHSNIVDGTTWNELLELEQRQFRVKSGLQVLDNEYKFLFEQPTILKSLLSTHNSVRKNGKLQRDFALKFYPDMFNLPVTSRFGYPLRKYPILEKVDRYSRLSRAKIDSHFNTKLERFKRIKMTEQRLESMIGGYKCVIDEGGRRARKAMREQGVEFTNKAISEMTASRTKSELFASLGFLI